MDHIKYRTEMEVMNKQGNMWMEKDMVGFESGKVDKRAIYHLTMEQNKLNNLSIDHYSFNFVTKLIGIHIFWINTHAPYQILKYFDWKFLECLLM